jgi:DinB family protein
MDGIKPLVDLNEFVWTRFKDDLADVAPEECDWRMLPDANTINVIVRHLRIEAEWHTACLERGEPMPMDASPELQKRIDEVPLDFEKNRAELQRQYERFNAALRATTLDGLAQRSASAYGASGKASAHMLGFHQAVHLSMHWAQIRTIRTLYKKTRGEEVPARYYPGNVSYPKPQEREPR